MDKKQEILKIIEDVHELGISRMNKDYQANDVIVALMNIVLLGVRRTLVPENITRCKDMFGEMCEQVKADLEKELANAKLE